MQTMRLELIKEYYNEGVLLRDTNDEVVEDYAQKMENGTIFPPIILGTYPDPKNPTQQAKAIVDGCNRYKAALKAKLKDMAVETRTYVSDLLMLQDMVKLNLTHGLRISEDDRNARIKLFKERGMEGKQIAPIFNLHESTVSRILRDLVKGTKSGPRHGSKKEKKVLAVFKAKAFLEMLERVKLTMRQRGEESTLSDIRDAFLPVSQDGKSVFVNKKAMVLLEDAIAHLEALAVNVRKEAEA